MYDLAKCGGKSGYVCASAGSKAMGWHMCACMSWYCLGVKQRAAVPGSLHQQCMQASVSGPLQAHSQDLCWFKHMLTCFRKMSYVSHTWDHASTACRVHGVLFAAHDSFHDSNQKISGHHTCCMAGAAHCLIIHMACAKQVMQYCGECAPYVLWRFSC